MKLFNSFSSRFLTITLALMASVSIQAHDFSVDGIYYNFLDDNNVEVTYKGSSIYEDEYKNEVVIPDSVTYNGVNYIVTSIGKNAFAYSALKTITIGNNVKSVGYDAFSNCNLLASVTMGTAVQNVGKYAFYNCSYLSVIDSVPNSLTTVEESAFRACRQLTAINLPDGVTTIGDYAFYECYRLASVTLGNGLTSIGSQAFMYCSALKSIVIPNSVTNIGASAFSCCSSLDSVAIGNGLRKISDHTFYKCSALVYFTMPDSIESIGKHAFFTCKSLKNINVPSTVTTIGAYAFSGCSELESIHIPEGVLEIRERTFENCSSLKSILLPQSITNIRRNAFVGCTTLGTIDFPEGVKSIEEGTFGNCTSLASITIPNSVMTIELGAFSNTAYYNDAKNWEEGVLYISNCLIEAKTSIAGDYSIKPGTRMIADYALFGCNNLTSVTFAQSVKSIGDASFYECKKMNVVNMSDSLQNIGNRAFAYCELLNPVTIPVGVKTFGEEVFMGCKSLVSVIWNAKECQDFPYFYVAPFFRISSKITSITFGDEVEYIPAGMCYGLSAVPSVTIPVNVKRIGKDAFESCTSMTSITWNAKHYCDTLDYSPFEGIEYIVKSFTFGEDIETIPPYVCKEMREVSEIIIPDGVISIGRHAFNYCTGIQSINIPKGVTTIGSAAFFHTQIRSVVVPEGVTEIGGWAFSECYSLNKIELPRSLKSIGNSAFKETYHIDTLICKALVPPTMGELPVFEGVKKANISLFVPKESIELYKAADQWKEFEQILAIPTVTPEDLFPTLWGLHRTDIEVHTTQTNTSHLTCFDEYIHYVPYNKQRIYLTNDRLTYLREENNQVLLYAPSYGINEDVVLYDWTLEVGDTLPVMLYDEKTRGEMFRVVGVSLITLLDGKEYKKWTLACGIEYIEGIGAINGEGYGNYLCLQHASHPDTYIGSPLVCASRNGQLLYQMDGTEMERLGAECLCDKPTIKDSAKDKDLGGRPTPTQWYVLDIETKDMGDPRPTVLRAETFSYTLENDSIVVNGRTFYQLACQSTKDTATTKSVVGALHFSEDKGNRVYFLRDGVEYLLYDFTAEPGDTIEIFAGINNYPQETTYTHVVADKDTTEDGACRMFLEVVFPEETKTVENAEKVWLAGLGSIDGIVHNTAKRASIARSSETQTSIMLCAWREDDCLYTTNHPDYETLGCIYNHELTSVEDIHTSPSYQKLLRDGQLLIIHEGKTYNVMGVAVE